MDYMIVNQQKTLFIRIRNGSPVICAKRDAQKFDYSKACNILSNLPRTMHKFGFKVEPISEVFPNTSESMEVKCLQKEYIVSPQVQKWIDKVQACNGLMTDASKRKNELLDQLSNIDKELSNCLHEIELSNNMNACAGYKEYKRTKIILERRRLIKDELSVITSILSGNVESVATDRIKKVVKRLGKRKFIIRDVNLDEIYI